MKNVSRNDLLAVPEVEFTDTWSPWHHRHVLDVIDAQLTDMGYQPMNERYELSDNGLNLFSTIGIAPMDRDPSSLGGIKQIGWRNSMQKHFALGFVAGEMVYVCSNLGFYGEFREVRIHDSRLTHDALIDFVRNAILSVRVEQDRYEDWFKQLVTLEVSDDEIKVLTYDAMAQGIVPPSKFNQFANNLEEERKAQDHGYRQTLAHWHGAVTRTLRTASMRNNMDRTRQLNSFLETIVTPATNDEFVV